MENRTDNKTDVFAAIPFKKSKNFKIAVIVAICIAAIIIIWAYVACIGSDSQPSSETQATETQAKEEAAQEKLTPYEKSKRKIPLTEQEKRELAKELSGDFSKINTKPVEDKGF